MGIGTGFARLLLFALLGWTALGAIGVTISFHRGERRQGRRNLAWIVAVWLIYISGLVTVSLRAKPRSLAPGHEHCFDSLCYSVERTETVPGYLAKPGERLVRVSIRVTNRSGKSSSGDSKLRLYLMDSQGRRWEQAAGLQGVHLSTRIGKDDTYVSAPVFMVPDDAEELELVLTHGRRFPFLLMIGDPDSVLHPPVHFSLAP
ncbi:MAG TPA: hypothetical protein VFS41_10715 [Edaphobacter sp.]|nr:hypothetical protein [Edaphobacter sp.]